MQYICLIKRDEDLNLNTSFKLIIVWFVLWIAEARVLGDSKDSWNPNRKILIEKLPGIEILWTMDGMNDEQLKLFTPFNIRSMNNLISTKFLKSSGVFAPKE